jgi:hypothetical protein
MSKQRDEQTKFASIMPVKPINIIWEPMAQHGVIFHVSALGGVANCMSNEIVFYLKHDPAYKVILYSNSRASAEGHLLALMKKILVSNSINGDTIPLTGSSALMMKNWLIALFLRSILSNVEFCWLLLLPIAVSVALFLFLRFVMVFCHPWLIY